jgi:hypothetical protein
MVPISRYCCGHIKVTSITAHKRQQDMDEGVYERPDMDQDYFTMLTAITSYNQIETRL